MNKGLKSQQLEADLNQLRFFGFLAKGGTNMLSIRKPDKHEILEALCRLENGEELTDRDIWILDEYTDEFEDFVEEWVD